VEIDTRALEMEESFVPTFMGAGVILGLSAGFSPGPLMALVISHSVSHGMREGVKAALAPLVTDVPIVLVCFLILEHLAASQPVLGGISLLGGAFVFYLGLNSIRTRNLHPDFGDIAPRSLGRGILVNSLSPHPYIFWLTVGAPMMVKAWGKSSIASIAFVGGFYFCLVGAKTLVAVVCGRSRHWLSGKVYLYTMRILGSLLLFFAFLLFRDGFSLMGWLR
jgi:threonine/homoserine/homoserine lactone efflux protein